MASIRSLALAEDIAGVYATLADLTPTLWDDDATHFMVTVASQTFFLRIEDDEELMKEKIRQHNECLLEEECPRSSFFANDLPCTNGKAGEWECKNVDLLSFVPIAEIVSTILEGCARLPPIVVDGKEVIQKVVVVQVGHIH